MDLYRSVGEFAHGWIFAARGVLRPRVREPFLLIGAAQLLLLIGLGYFHIPALVNVLEPVVRAIGGEEATHYPELFWNLPELFRTANLLVALLLTPLALGVATLRFAGRRGDWADGLRRMPGLLGIGLLGPGIAWAITTAFNAIPLKIVLSSFVVRMGLQGLELGLIVLLYSLLAYTPSYLMLEALPLAAALRKSVRLAVCKPLTTLLLFIVPFGLLFPVSFFLFEMNLATSGLVPETVGLLLAIRIVLNLLLMVLSSGATTAIYLSFPEGRR